MIRVRAAVWSVVVVVVSLVTSGLLDAHHGTLVSYDRDKAWTAKAVVTDFRYVNPHAQIYFDVKDDKDHAGHWSGELLPNPAQLIASGWTRKRSTEMLKAGTPITITVAPSRAGGMVVLVLRILNEKGEELLGAAPPPGSAPRSVP
jgi:Family of unknown function (DUF6152)